MKDEIDWQDIFNKAIENQVSLSKTFHSQRMSTSFLLSSPERDIMNLFWNEKLCKVKTNKILLTQVLSIYSDLHPDRKIAENLALRSLSRLHKNGHIFLKDDGCKSVELSGQGYEYLTRRKVVTPSVKKIEDFLTLKRPILKLVVTAVGLISGLIAIIQYLIQN